MSNAFQRVPMGEVATFKTGKLDSNAAVEDGVYPFFTCSRDTFRTNTYSFDDEVVLLAGNNANGIYPLKYFKGKFDVYQRTYVIRPIDKSRLCTRFLYFALRPQLDHLRSVSTGSATKFLTMGLLSNLEIPLPDLPTQRKIAGILSAYDDLIENNLRRIKILEQMAQSLYREWFVHFRIPPEVLTKAGLPPEIKLVDSPLGKIPEGWEVVKLKDIIDFINAGETAGSHLDDVPYLPIDCLPRRSLAVLEKRPSCEAQSSLIRFRKHDILFGAMRCYFHKVVIAPFDGTTRKTCFVFRSKERASYSWSLLTLFQDETIAYASNHSKGATIPYAVWEGSLAEMKTIKPPGDLRLRFEELVWPMLERIAGAFDRNENLKQTRDLLLPMLLSATRSGRQSVPATNT